MSDPVPISSSKLARASTNQSAQIPTPGSNSPIIPSALISIRTIGTEHQHIAEQTQNPLQGRTTSPSPIFDYNGQMYVIKDTLGEGSCALHALLGEEIDKTYRFAGNKDSSSANAKAHFIQALVQALSNHNPIIVSLFIKIISNYLNELLKDPPTKDESALMLFKSTKEGLELLDRWKKLREEKNKEIKAIKNKEADLWSPLVQADGSPILNRIMEEVRREQERGSERFHGISNEEAKRKLKTDPGLLLSMIDEIPDECLALLDIENKSAIDKVRSELNQANQDREDAEKKFISTKEMVQNYITVLKNPKFYLNIPEIELAAHLFNKKAQIVNFQGGKIFPADNLINADADGEVIIIYHGINHFSRCIRSDIPSQDSVNSDLTYFKNHLVATRFRGDAYQIGHFTYFCLYHLFKKRAFQAEIESQGYGNLDDIQIKLHDKIKAYQVKFFKNPIILDGFWNENESETKNAGMHVGKFFDGWLSLQENGRGRNIIPYLLTNTSLDSAFLNFLELTKQKGSKKQLKFEESFINGTKSILHKQRVIISLSKVPKNFLEKSGLASQTLSSKVWECLQKKGFFDKYCFPTQTIIEYAKKDNFGLGGEEFSELRAIIKRARGSLTLKNIIDELQIIKENYEQHQKHPGNEFNDIELFEHLFQQACLYLRNKKLHASFLKKDTTAQKEEFKRFLRAFRFNINRESLEELQKRIQGLLQSKYPAFSPLLYPHINFEIQSWFTQTRPFVKNQGEKTPIIDHIWMQKTIEQADICRQAIEKLFDYSLRQLEQVQTTIHGLQIQRKKLLKQIDQSLSPASFLLITGPKGIGKSALVKIYLEKQRCPWFAFRGEDLSRYNSLDAFLTHHGLSLDDKMLERFDQAEKKIIYIDSIEKISKKNGAFLDLINLFRRKNWTIFLSSLKNIDDWLRENIEGLSNKEIQVLEIPLLREEKQEREHGANFLTPFLDKYPILSHIRWDRLFQPYYNDLFEYPLYLKFFCEEMEKLPNPESYFNSVKVLKNFEQKIWKKAVRHEGCAEEGISELRQRLMIDIAIKQVLGHPIASILRTDDSKKLEAISLLKKNQLLDKKGRITNQVFIELSLKMYFQEMMDDWLLGNELDNLSDDKLGGIYYFDLLFSDFLAAWFDEEASINIDPLVDFLKKKDYVGFEGFFACFFQRLLRMEKKQEVEKMLKAAPDLANLPIFLDGRRVQFPINVAIDTLDMSLIRLLVDYGAKLHSPLKDSPNDQQKGRRPRDLMNPVYHEQKYSCLIPLRGAIASAKRLNSSEKTKELLTYLIEKGAQLRDPADSYHRHLSLLHVAVENYDPEIVSFLLDHGMNPEVYNLYARSPLGEALENFLAFCHKAREDQANGKDLKESIKYMFLAKEIFKRLVERGARTTSLMYQEALQRLVRERHYLLAKFLLENKFNPTEEDQHGLNAFDYAWDNYEESQGNEDKQFFSFLQDKYPAFFIKWLSDNMLDNRS